MSNLNINSYQSSSWQIQRSLQGRVAIFWDIENCSLPSDVPPEDVAGNIWMSLRTINGPVTMFSAYGDCSTFPRRLRKGCQRTGVKLVDVPNDAAYKTILVDMFLFALDNRQPSSILLISRDKDFAPALHVLGRRGYTIILVIPSRVGVSSTLSSAGRFLCDWSSVARGHGFVLQARANVDLFPVKSSRNESIDSSKSYHNVSNLNINSYQSSSWKIQSSLQGPVAIFWDIENCAMPSDVPPEDVAGNIRMSLRAHTTINGPVTMFSAYGDFSAFPRRLRKGCHRTGVKLVDVPNNAAYKTILVDMFLFALDNRQPSSILLISGDKVFAPALHVLGRRGYTIILVIPSRVGVSSALSCAGRFLWDWSSVAHGHGFVPHARANVDLFSVESSRNESIDISKSYYNTRNCSVMSESTSECNNNSISKS